MDYISTNPFDAIGGLETIEKLVEAFYPRVLKDPDLSPLFVTDINEVMRKQKMFLSQFLGGPALYSNEFGHPRLRMRHMPFEITPQRANAWLACMKAAMDDIELDGPEREFLYNRLTQTAYHMVNASE